MNEEVLFADEDVVRVTRKELETLKERAAKNKRKRIRLCAHRSPEDKVHEMLIVHTRETYVRPHKHLKKTESFHVLEGEAELVLFDDGGKISDVIPLGDYMSGKCVFYRMNRPIYHSLLIHTDFLVFHEASNGPFRREESIFASWSPAEEDEKGVASFISELLSAVAVLKGTPVLREG